MPDCCLELTERLTKAEQNEILQLVALGHDRFRRENGGRLIPSPNEMFCCEFAAGTDSCLDDGKRKKYTVELIGVHAQLGPVARVYINTRRAVTVWEVRIRNNRTVSPKKDESAISYSNPACLGRSIYC